MSKTKSFIRKFKDNLFVFFFTPLTQLLFKVLYYTYTFEEINPHHMTKARLHGQFSGAFLLGCWHEQFVGCCMIQKGRPFQILASQSSFGRVMGQVMKSFGYHPVYGSQTRNGKDKGGKQARKHLIAGIEKGYPVGFTIDGSIGPPRICKPGIIVMAEKTSSMILPSAAIYSSYWELQTWDRLKIPKPFARIAVSYGTPYLISTPLNSITLELETKKLADLINEQELIARQYMETGIVTNGFALSRSRTH